MTFKEGLDLRCFVQNNTTSTLNELSIGYELNSCDLALTTFYKIDVISPVPDPYDSSKEYTEIHSGGIVFICELDYLKVKNIIKNVSSLSV
jgi:hypothetical protein